MMSYALICYPAEWVEKSINVGNIILQVKERSYYDDKKNNGGVNREGDRKHGTLVFIKNPFPLIAWAISKEAK